MLTLVEPEKYITEKESYPYNGAFRFPSIGMIACPPEVPAEVLGIQLCFSMGNDLPFVNWGVPGMSVTTAVVDFTNSHYAFAKIVETLRAYYESEAKKNIRSIGEKLKGKVEVPDKIDIRLPLMFRYETRDLPVRHMKDENLALISYLHDTIIEKYGATFIYIHGISGFYDEAFYDCIALMKAITVAKNACVILNHVISSKYYGDGRDSMREALSHQMIRKTHEEASALMDWSWFVAPATENMIRDVSNASIKRDSAISGNASFYINKFVQPNKCITPDDKMPRPSTDRLFYTYKGVTPIFMELPLTRRNG